MTIKEMICDLDNEQHNISFLEDIIDCCCIKIQDIKIEQGVECSCSCWPCVCE